MSIDSAAAFVYHTRFGEFKQRFDSWLKWHIKLASPDRHDAAQLVNGSEVDKALGISLDQIQSTEIIPF